MLKGQNEKWGDHRRKGRAGHVAQNGESKINKLKDGDDDDIRCCDGRIGGFHPSRDLLCSLNPVDYSILNNNNDDDLCFLTKFSRSTSSRVY